MKYLGDVGEVWKRTTIDGDSYFLITNITTCAITNRTEYHFLPLTPKVYDIHYLAMMLPISYSPIWTRVG